MCGEVQERGLRSASYGGARQYSVNKCGGARASCVRRSCRRRPAEREGRHTPTQGSGARPTIIVPHRRNGGLSFSWSVRRGANQRFAISRCYSMCCYRWTLLHLRLTLARVHQCRRVCDLAASTRLYHALGCARMSCCWRWRWRELRGGQRSTREIHKRSVSVHKQKQSAGGGCTRREARRRLRVRCTFRRFETGNANRRTNK